MGNLSVKKTIKNNPNHILEYQDGFPVRVLKHFKRFFRSIFLRTPSNTITKNFGAFSIFIPDDRAWAFSNEGYYEHNVEFWLKTISNRYRDELKNTAFMDIGANIGYYSVLLSKLFSKIYAFEPVSSTVNILKKNIVLSGSANISHLNYALSDNAGNEQINLYDNSGQNSLVRRKDVDGQYIQCSGIQSVELVSLDGISKKMNFLKPGLMKIDVEGFEINVLKGAKNTIEDAKPIIIFEFSSNTSKDASYTKEDILHLEFLRSNYSFLGLSEDYKDNILHTSLDSKIANIVAIPNDMIEKFKEDFKDLISL